MGLLRPQGLKLAPLLGPGLGPPIPLFPHFIPYPFPISLWDPCQDRPPYGSTMGPCPGSRPLSPITLLPLYPPGVERPCSDTCKGPGTGPKPGPSLVLCLCPALYESWEIIYHLWGNSLLRGETVQTNTSVIQIDIAFTLFIVRDLQGNVSIRLHVC